VRTKLKKSRVLTIAGCPALRPAGPPARPHCCKRPATCIADGWRGDRDRLAEATEREVSVGRDLALRGDRHQTADPSLLVHIHGPAYGYPLGETRGERVLGAGPAPAGGVEAALAEAERLGGKRQMGPERAPTGLVMGHFTDPEGNLIGVAGTK
jgi:hypothetical protein